MNNIKRCLIGSCILELILGCFECHTSFISKPDEMNLEIKSIRAIVESDNKLRLSYVSYSSPGSRDTCVAGNFISNTLRIHPYFQDIRDPLTLIEKTEGIYSFRNVPSRPKITDNNTLNVILFYDIDSSGFITNKKFYAKLYKDVDCDFHVH
jgi:hypothetical protein